MAPHNPRLLTERPVSEPTPKPSAPDPGVLDPETTKRPWLVLVAMTGALSLIMLDQTVVTVALPTMARNLSLSATGQQWVVSAYVLSLAAFVALAGKLGDLIGRVTTFRLGMVLFALSSVACGLAPVGTWIIASRALQGAGAALMMPASAAIVMGAFAPSAEVAPWAPTPASASCSWWSALSSGTAGRVLVVARGVHAERARRRGLAGAGPHRQAGEPLPAR